MTSGHLILPPVSRTPRSYSAIAQLSYIVVKTSPTWEQVKPAPGNEAPARRTGHVLVTHGDTLYLCA